MGTVLYITTALPTLTLTFVYREIWALVDEGLQIEAVSMNKPALESISDEARSLYDSILYLDHVSLGRKFAAIASVAVSRPLYLMRCVASLLRATPRKFPRDHVRLIYHLIEACYLYTVYRVRDISHIHAHLITGPTSIAMFLAELLNVPFSFTMHGSQIYLNPVGLREKLRRCKYAVSVTEFHKRAVLEHYGQQFEDRFHIVRCGLDLKDFPSHGMPKGSANAFNILGVGRLVEVKGFEYLIRACALLRDRSVAFECHIVGGGPLEVQLCELVREFGLLEQVKLEGAKTQSELRNFYARADVFVLPCVVASDGGRDGLPVVLMEAMAWHVPVVSTRLVGIPELVHDQDTGALVAPRDSEALADAIDRIRSNPALAEEWGNRGRRRVEQEFELKRSAVKLKQLFSDSLEQRASSNHTA